MRYRGRAYIRPCPPYAEWSIQDTVSDEIQNDGTCIAVPLSRRLCSLWPALALPSAAGASFLPPEMLDTAATYIAWFVICIVPIGVIVLFWLVHVLPEKIAEKRHHPQKDAIHTLCLLSLAFGGLLWPLAWLWAYTKPVGYQLAYGTDKHDDYFHEIGRAREGGRARDHEIAHLREELDAMAEQGTLPPKLATLRADLAAVEVAAQAKPRRTIAQSVAPPTRPRPEPVERTRDAPDGSPPPRDLLVLRLADLHQVQVAAVEHGVAGHRRHHPDRRDGSA